MEQIDYAKQVILPLPLRIKREGGNVPAEFNQGQSLFVRMSEKEMQLVEAAEKIRYEKCTE